MDGNPGKVVHELPRTAGLSRYAAAALVFGASASVLVVEVVALRLLAPYLGLTLETNTIVIGLALAAIAMGSWAGGRLADRISPRYALGPLLAVSGVTVAATPFAVRGAGLISDALLMTTAGLAIIVPGALLAAVTPMVTKLRLRSLSETGTVVGQVGWNRHCRGDRRHCRDRFRAYLTGAGQWHHGWAWSRAGHCRCDNRGTGSRLAISGRSRRAGLPRRSRGHGRARRM